MIAETFYANTDWPQNNYKIWKKNVNGRWRWILFDTDSGFGLHFDYRFDHNTVNYVFQESDTHITYPLRRLMANEQFKQKFLNRFCIQVSSTFSTPRVNAVMDSLSAKIRNEIVYHKQRWGENNFDNEMEVMKTFAKQRPNRLMQFLGSYFFQTSSVIDIYMRSNIDGVAFTFNEEPVPDNPITLKYFKNKDISIEASEVAGYCFKQWELAVAPQENTSVAFGAYWNYWDKNGQPAENWMDSNYDDATWKKGYAPLGYGNFDKKNTVDYGSDENNKYTTAYFRKKLNINNLSNKENFILSLFVDDGAAVYVNGREIGRLNLPAGKLSFTTYTWDCNDGVNTYFTVPKSLLLEGENTIAVEVHQCNSSSSDLIFDLSFVYMELPQGDNILVTETPIFSIKLFNSVSLRAVYEKEDESKEPTSSEQKVYVYPIVFDDYMQIGNAKNQAIKLYSISGKMVYDAVAITENQLINLGFLRQGPYVLRVDNKAFKLIKK
jgi:hypothetical protein